MCVPERELENVVIAPASDIMTLCLVSASVISSSLETDENVFQGIRRLIIEKPRAQLDR